MPASPLSALIFLQRTIGWAHDVLRHMPSLGVSSLDLGPLSSGSFFVQRAEVSLVYRTKARQPPPHLYSVSIKHTSASLTFFARTRASSTYWSQSSPINLTDPRDDYCVSRAHAVKSGDCKLIHAISLMAVLTARGTFAL